MRRARLAGSITLAIGCALAGAVPATAALPLGYDAVRVDSPNPVTNGRFGLSLANVGDVNGDGRDDLLTGTDKHGAQDGTGQVAVLNGANPAGPPLRIYEQPDTDSNAGAGGDRRAGFGNALGKLADLGSCPGFTGDPGDLCTSNPIGGTDGIAEHIVASSGIDVDADNDDLGVVYVFDGATGALLKRLQMPTADRAEQASGVPSDPSNDPRFGRAVLNPTGLSPCDENGGAAFGGPGIEGCPAPLPPPAVRNGDVVGDDDIGDIVVAATDYSELKGTAHPDSECATQAGTAECTGSGRVYAYSGADIAGEDPSDVLDNEAITIKNPLSQPDDPSPPSPFSNDEAFGIQLIPIGDAGSCTAVIANPGEDCPSANSSNATDGKSDFAIVANAYDNFGFSDVGESLEFDGATLSVIKDTEYPEPRIDSSWGIAQNGTTYPPLGDAADTTAPDYYVSDIQWGGKLSAEGRGFLISGAPSRNGSFREFPSIFGDPTPQNGEQFGLASAGLGDVGGADSHNELAIGAIGPHNPAPNPDVINDLHIFDPITALPLQTLRAPDQQGGEIFGAAVQPMGDLNGDGFLDLVASAAFYDLIRSSPPCSPAPCGDAGRVYFFLSDDTPPPSPPSPPSQPSPGAPPEPIVQSGREVEIEASTNKVKIIKKRKASRRAGATRAKRRPKNVTLRGRIEAFGNEAACEPGQDVILEQRKRGSFDYKPLDQVRSDGDGQFSVKIKPRKTRVYRARVQETSHCLENVSNREIVEVTRKKKKKGRKKG